MRAMFLFSLQPDQSGPEYVGCFVTVVIDDVQYPGAIEHEYEDNDSGYCISQCLQQGK